MESHSQHQVKQQEPGTSADKMFTPEVELSREFKVLEDLAIKYLDRLKGLARESDDAQERFTNSGYNFVVGAELTSKMATRAAASASKISA